MAIYWRPILAQFLRVQLMELLHRDKKKVQG